MSQKIILSSEELIVCPKCQYKFALGDGITRQTIERYEQDFEAVLKERSAEVRLELEKEAERKLSKIYTSQLEALKEQLTGSQQALTEMRSRFEQVQQEVKDKALAEFELEKKLLLQELCEKDVKLNELREQEVALRLEKAKLEEFRRKMELELHRKLDEERKKIEEQIRTNEGERFKRKEAEYQKRLRIPKRPTRICGGNS